MIPSWSSGWCDTCGEGHLINVWLTNEGTVDGSADVVIRDPESVELARTTRTLPARTEEAFLVTVDDWRDVVQTGATLEVEAQGNCIEGERQATTLTYFSNGELDPPDCNGFWPGDGSSDGSGCSASASVGGSAPVWMLVLAVLGMRRRRA